MKNGLEIYNLLIDLRQWIDVGAPKSEEPRLIKKLDRLIFEMGKSPDSDEISPEDAGILSANETFGKFLEKADPS
jgi:hypothetical protein